MEDDLYANVLDEDAWTEAGRYWRQQVDALETSLGQAGEWPSSEPRPLAGDFTARAAAPVCEGRSERLDRSFRILQHKVDEQPDVAAWVEDYERNPNWREHERPRFPRATLVVTLSFSESTASLARSLLRFWMTPGTSVEQMRGMIDASASP
jgi:hypothetical protein